MDKYLQLENRHTGDILRMRRERYLYAAISQMARLSDRGKKETGFGAAETAELNCGIF